MTSIESAYAVLTKYTGLWEDMEGIANQQTNYEDILLVADQISELKKFLILKTLARDTEDNILSASKTISSMWQVLVSFTRVYPKLCHSLLPVDVEVRLIHCKPQMVCEANRDAYANRYVTTYDMYKEVFGQYPPRAIWPRPIKSGSATLSASQTSTKEIVDDLTNV